MRIQYGGSMKPENAAELLAQPDIDGGLIGGASLDAEPFLAIVAAARHDARRSRWSCSTAGGSPRPGRATPSSSPRRPCSTGSGPRWPHTTLEASGRAVGLPDGQQGNSEVGHLNLGAGRVVRQDLVRIGDDVASGAFFENAVLVDACRPRGAGRRCT